MGSVSKVIACGGATSGAHRRRQPRHAQRQHMAPLLGRTTPADDWPRLPCTAFETDVALMKTSQSCPGTSLHGTSGGAFRARDVTSRVSGFSRTPTTPDPSLPATTRRRNRTFQAGGCPALPVLKAPVSRRSSGSCGGFDWLKQVAGGHICRVRDTVRDTNPRKSRTGRRIGNKST
jgi:hypothetical protein